MEKITTRSDTGRITNAPVSFLGPLTTSIVYKGRYVRVCVCVFAREGRKNSAFPSIFYLSDRGLPLYPPFFLSRGQTSGT